MNKLFSTVAIAGLAALGACGGQRDDAAAENVEQAYDNKADMIDANARNAQTETVRDALEDQADAVRAEGDAKADAIDDADVNGMSPAEVNAAANATR